MAGNESKAKKGHSCPYCDGEIAASLPVCQACKVTMFYCPKCHKPVRRDEEVCPNCGTNIRREAIKEN